MSTKSFSEYLFALLLIIIHEWPVFVTLHRDRRPYDWILDVLTPVLEATDEIVDDYESLDTDLSLTVELKKVRTLSVLD